MPSRTTSTYLCALRPLSPMSISRTLKLTWEYSHLLWYQHNRQCSISSCVPCSSLMGCFHLTFAWKLSQGILKKLCKCPAMFWISLCWVQWPYLMASNECSSSQDCPKTFSRDYLQLSKCPAMLQRDPPLMLGTICCPLVTISECFSGQVCLKTVLWLSTRPSRSMYSTLQFPLHHVRASRWTEYLQSLNNQDVL